MQKRKKRGESENNITNAKFYIHTEYNIIPSFINFGARKGNYARKNLNTILMHAHRNSLQFFNI